MARINETRGGPGGYRDIRRPPPLVEIEFLPSSLLVRKCIAIRQKNCSEGPIEHF